MTNDMKFFVGMTSAFIALMIISIIMLRSAEVENALLHKKWSINTQELDSIVATMPITHTVQWVQLRSGQKYAVLNGIAYLQYETVWLDGKQLPRKYKYEPTMTDAMRDSIFVDKITKQQYVTAKQAVEIAKIRLDMIKQMSSLQARVDSLEKYELIHKRVPLVLFM